MQKIIEILFGITQEYSSIFQKFQFAFKGHSDDRVIDDEKEPGPGVSVFEKVVESEAESEDGNSDLLIYLCWFFFLLESWRFIFT